MDRSGKQHGADSRKEDEEVTRIHFIFGGGDPLYRRCAPSFPFVKDDLSFDENPQPDDGWVVVCNAIRKPLLTRVPRSRRIFIVGESSLRHHPVTYLNQFGVLISPFRVAGYGGQWFQSHPAIPWFFGASFCRGDSLPALGYRDLANLPVPEKREVVSVVVSTKVVHPGHRKRLRFIERLKDLLGDRLLVFGRGIHEIGDKADAILPFAYHLALENRVEPYYLTEKFADGLLGYALPVYSGCPDVERWFPAGCFERVELERPDEAAVRIIGFMEVGVWRKRLPLIIEARRRAMEQETVFNVVARAITAYPDNTSLLKVFDRVLPPSRPLGERIRFEIVRAYHQITFRTRLGRER